MDTCVDRQLSGIDFTKKLSGQVRFQVRFQVNMNWRECNYE